MVWIRRLFRIAGIYGLIVFGIMYFSEPAITSEHKPINYPEFFYGFNGVGIAWQLAFLVIARDPMRFRPMMIPAVVEKFSYAAAIAALLAAGRVAAGAYFFAAIDLVLGTLFMIAFLRLRCGSAQ